MVFKGKACVIATLFFTKKRFLSWVSYRSTGSWQLYKHSCAG
jgi:hypothetical protein